MGSNQGAEYRFRKQLRNARERRGWSQAHLAELLRDSGIRVHPTTVAKIEAGERAARIDELAAIAELFEVSIDTLLGRSVSPKSDEMYNLRALLDTAQQAMWQVSTIETTLRDRIAEVVAPGGHGKSIASGCERSADALAEAHKTLYETLNPSGSGPAKRMIRKILIDKLQREESDDEAQS